ncbi:hypothetical protein [Litchfieldia alkalitelluris]|uniref:hypothetical protein n=1 Tax=Litchfieldia alkalitelluris TaxID=304268 RepID=UPI000997A925|nr:hypothetical protein [Litchfieldia alkalitelluris]
MTYRKYFIIGLFSVLLLALVGCSNKSENAKEFHPENTKVLGSVQVFNAENIYGELQEEDWFKKHKKKIVRLREFENHEIIQGNKRIIAYSLGQEAGERKNTEIVIETNDNTIYLNVTDIVKDVPQESPFPTDILFIEMDHTKHKIKISYNKKDA